MKKYTIIQTHRSRTASKVQLSDRHKLFQRLYGYNPNRERFIHDGIHFARQSLLNGIHRRWYLQDLGNQGLVSPVSSSVEALADDLTWDTQTWHQGFLNWVIQRTQQVRTTPVSGKLIIKVSF